MKTKLVFASVGRIPLILCCAALLMCSRHQAGAVPAAPTVTAMQQPDGTVFQARLFGDEFFHYYTTADGHPLVYDAETHWWTFAAVAAEGVGKSTGLRPGRDTAPTGAWTPKVPAAELQARATRRFEASVPSVRKSKTRDGGPSPVTANVAMFLTTFSDRVAASDPGGRPIYQAPAFESLFFSTSDPNAYTAANLYKQMSYGLHTVTSGPAGIQTWATAPKTHDYYGAGVSGVPNVSEDGARVQELVKWRVQNADATFDFGPYDTDNNGTVDLVCIIYQGTDQANSKLVNDIWPIRWTLDANTGPGTPGTGPGAYQSTDLNGAGNPVKVNDFIVVSELFPGATSPMATIGVFAHEYGHGIGWPDLYDSDYSSSGLGYWDLMALGCYNQKTTGGSKGDCPSWANAWCRIKSGWLAPTNPTYNIRGFRIPEAKKENFCLKLSLNGAGGLEYFLVENRQRTGWDQGLPGGPTGPASGLMIWHIDDNQTRNTNEWWSIPGTGGLTNGGNRLVAMEQADGLFHLDRSPPTTAAPANVGNGGDAGDLFTAGSSFTGSTVPSSRTYAGAVTNVAVRNISAASATDASITADIYMQADQEFAEVLTMNPADGLNYYTIPSLSGTAKDNVGLLAVQVALFRHLPSGGEWYNWTTSAWQTAYFDTVTALSGSGNTRDFNIGITVGHVTPGSYSFFAKAIDTSSAGSAWRESRFTVLEDPNAPDVTISEPSNWENYPAGVVPNFVGTAVNTIPTNSVEIAMKKETGPEAGRFYNWTSNTWSPAGSYGAPNAYLDSGANWVVNMAPRPLDDGNYTLFVRVTSGDTRVSPWRAVAFRVGRPFRVAISSPGHQSATKHLTEFSGTVDEPSGTGLTGGVVTLTLTDPGGRQWNGSAWVSAAATFTASAGNGSWVTTAVPADADLPSGLYALTASASTNGGESTVLTAGVNAINFHMDRTLPTGAVTSPAQNAVITTPTLPPFRGTAADNNGIAWVNCFIRRNSDQAFWNGSTWTEDVTGAPDGNVMEHAPPVAFLSASYTAATGEWICTSPLPAPESNMVSGSYSFIVIPGDSAGNYFQTESTITVDYHRIYTWTGLTLRDGIPGNDSTYWGTPANWSPYGVPDVDDIAVIANGDRVDSTVSRTVYGLQLSSGMINFTNGAGPSGTLTTTNASIWTGGTMTGIWENAAGAVLTISGSSGKELRDGSILNNSGHITWLGGAPISAEGNGFVANTVINNRNGGRFRMEGSTDVFSRNSGRAGVPVFNNEAGGIVESADGTPRWSTFSFNNAGTLEFTGGAVLRLNTVTAFLDASPVTGTGSLVQETGSFTLKGDLHMAGPQVLLRGGDIIGHGDNSAAFKVSAGGRIRLYGGVYFNTFTVASGHRIEIEDAPEGPLARLFRDGMVLDNYGTVNWRGTAPIQCEGNGFTANPIFNNHSGGVFNASGGTHLFSRASGRAGVPVFNNEAGALFQKVTAIPAVPVLTVDTAVFNNQGAVVCDSGVLAFRTTLNHASTTPLTGAGAFEFQTGRLGITGLLRVTDTSLFLLGGDIVSESGTAVLSASGAARIHLQGGSYFSKFTVNAGDRLEIDDPATGAVARLFRDGFVLDNSGTVTWPGGSPILAQGDGWDPNPVINNKAGGLFLASSDGVLFNRASGRAGVPVLNNEAGGTFRKSAGSGELAFHTFILNNAGDLACDSGVVAFTTTVNHNSPTPLTGPGTWEMRGGRLGITGPLRVTDTSLFLLGGDIVSESGTAVLSASGAARIHLQGGSYFSKFTVNAGDRLEIDDPATGAVARLFRDGFVLDNSGTVTWPGGSPILAQGDGWDPNPVINNKAGGLFLASADGVLFNRASGRAGVPVLNNEAGGTFRKSAGTGDLAFHTFHLVNNGAIGCLSGRILFTTRFVHESSSPLVGPGLFRLSGGNLELRGPLTADNTQFTIAAGDLNMHNDGTAQLDVANGGSFRAQGGRFFGAWTLAAGAQLDFEAGDGGDAAKFFADGSVFTNRGHVRWLGGGPIQAEGNGFVANPVFLNKSGAQFEFAAGGDPFSRASGRAGAPVFVNEAGALMENTAGVPVNFHTFQLDQQGLARSGAGGITYNTEIRAATGSVFEGTAAHRFLAGNLRINGEVTAHTALFEISGGTTFGSADARFTSSGTGGWKWTGGTFTSHFAVSAGSRFFIADGNAGASVKYFTDGSVFENSGSVEWTGAGPIQAEGNGFVDNPVINNLAGASFTDAATGVFNRASYRAGTPEFNNHGTVIVGPGIGDWTMEGWNFAQHATGSLLLDVGGSAAGQFDRLSVNRTATLAGTVSVTKLNGYAPAEGTTFPFLTAGSVTGTFANVTGGFAADYTGTTATLRAAPVMPLTFEQWAASKGLTGGNALPEADPDKDGFSNFFEYVHNMSPTAASGPPDTAGTASIGGQQWLTLHFRRYDDREAAGVTYTPQTGSSLGNWSAAGIVEEVDPDAPVIPGSTAVRCRVLVEAGNEKFLRVRATRP
ncbi:MAG: M6 family metalloprotease domain-containing protein [Verrucomicrobiales bacterium]|nr:M6 family metalloprotease domain-containing protein [Verrucomicrobiales bacterium]